MKQKYGMLVDVIRRDILGGKYRSGQPLPSVRALMRRFKVSSATAQRAFEELSKQGMIAGRRGSGTVVTKLGASRKIGLIVPGVAYSEFFSLVVGEISRCATRDGYVLLLGNMSSSRVSERLRRAKKFARELVKEQVAGVIYQPFEFVENAERQNREIVSILDKAGIPVVLLSCDIEPPPGRSKFDVVGINNMDAGYRLGNHLLSVGARKIDFLLRPNTAPSGRNRMRGVVTAINMALADGGAKNGPKFRVLNAEPDNLSALKRHLRGGKPDAFVCSGDITAAQFKQTLEKAGLRVPDDVLLAGFNDLQMASLLTPPTDAAKRAAFQNKIRANGHDIAWGLLAMTVACTCVYAMMFASGFWIYGRTALAASMTAVAALSGVALWPVLRQLNGKAPS